MAWVDDVRTAVAHTSIDALATGRTAARLWGIRVPTPTIEVWWPRGGPQLPGMHPSVRDGVPVVDAITAILLLVPIRKPEDLVSASTSLRLSPSELCSRADAWIAARGPNSSAVRPFVDAVASRPAPDSGLEVRMSEVLRRAGLGRGAILHHRVEAGLRSYEVDFAFPVERVVLELDGWQFHRTKDAFARDRSRDVELAAAGWVVLRFTHADLEHRPAWVIAQLRRTLAARRHH